MVMEIENVLKITVMFNFEIMFYHFFIANCVS